MDWRLIVQAASRREDRRAHQEAWRKLYDACSPSVRLLARMMVGSRPGYDLSGLEQGAFVKAFQGIDQLTLTEGRELQCIKAWMHTIARNHIFDEMRRKRTRAVVDAPSFSLDDVEISDDRGAVNTAAIEQTLADPEATIYLRQILDALSLEDRLLFFHRCIDKMEFEEIAELITSQCDAPCNAAALRKRLQRLLPALVAFAEAGPAAIKGTSRVSWGQKSDALS